MIDLKQLLAGAIDGDRARSHVVEISKFHRGLGSRGYRQAADYLCDYLTRSGLDVTSVDSPLDNRTRTGSYVNPYAWEPSDAMVRMVSPEVATLVSFRDSPTCLRSWSAATGPDGVTAEVCHVGKGTSPSDYEGRDVRGKIVFCDAGMDWRVHALAVERFGALGFISDDISPIIPPWKTREKFYDAVMWFTLSERQLDGTANRGWGISISPRQGDRLRQLLASGPVTLWVKVDARTFEGTMENPLATIEGSCWPEQEVLLVAHLCHTQPGAVDNAAGCAHITEVAASLQTLIADGKLPRPKRSIRFLYGPEGHSGNVYFHQNSHRLSSIHGSLCSHVGGDPEQLHGPLVMMKSSAALPNYLDDLCCDVLDEIPSYFPTPGMPVRVDAYVPNPPLRMSTNPFAYVAVPRYMGGDSVQNNAWGVPSIEMSRRPNLFWHTPYDTADKSSPEEFSKLGWAYAVIAYTIANAGCETGIDLMLRVAARAQSRLSSAAADARSCSDRERACRAVDRLRYHAERDERAVSSALALVSDADEGDRERSQQVADSAIRRLRAAAEAELDMLDRLLGPFPEPQYMDARKPRREGQGLFHMKDLVTRLGDRYATDRHSVLGPIYEIINLSDGQRTVDDIVRAIGHELPMIPEQRARDMVQALSDLEILRM